jgi:hypothetical protein
MSIPRRGRWAILLGYAAIVVTLVGLGYLAYLALTEDSSSRYNNIQKLRGDTVCGVPLTATV